MIKIYTDGSCPGNPGYGGWGYVLDYKGYRKVGGDHEFDTTNNRMELTAVIEALKAIHDKSIPTVVYSDSNYVVKSYDRLEHWKKGGWQTSSKNPVANQDLWQKLDALASQFNSLRLQWIKGHNGNKWNEFANDIAQTAANNKA